MDFSTPFTLSRRSFRRVAWACLGVMVLHCLLLGVLPPGVAWQRVFAGGLLLINALALPLILLRARYRPEEARGWRLMAAGVALAVAANALLGGRFLDLFSTRLERGEWATLAFYLGAGLLQVAAVQAMPWREGDGRHRGLLGALLFAASIGLLFWMVGVWRQGVEGGPIHMARLGVLGLRASLVGGVMVYRLAEAPGRVRGPLGWMVMSALAGGTFLILLAWLGPPLPSGGLASGAYGLIVAYPLCLLLSVLHPAPVEAPSRQGGDRRADLIPYIPFALALAALGFGLPRSAWALPVYFFLFITCLLLVLQFHLVRDLRAAKEHLEIRVRERTQALEAAQSVVLRTERMNTLAVLGAGLAHDLKNLLGVVRNFSILIQEDLREGRAPDPEDFGAIQTASNQALDLAQRLMAFGRGEGAETEDFHPAQRLKELASLLRAALPSNVRLLLRLPPERDTLHGDPFHFDQVVVNLVLNARDAMPGGGEIRIELTSGRTPSGKPSVELAVEDTGCGMPAEVLGRIFDPFYTTKEDGRGTGLGLASVKGIVQGMGGRLEVDSVAGQGTRFLLSFPAVVPQVG